MTIDWNFKTTLGFNDFLLINTYAIEFLLEAVVCPSIIYIRPDDTIHFN